MVAWRREMRDEARWFYLPAAPSESASAAATRAPTCRRAFSTRPSTTNKLTSKNKQTSGQKRGKRRLITRCRAWTHWRAVRIAWHPFQLNYLSSSRSPARQARGEDGTSGRAFQIKTTNMQKRVYVSCEFRNLITKMGKQSKLDK